MLKTSIEAEAGIQAVVKSKKVQIKLTVAEGVSWKCSDPKGGSLCRIKTGDV